MKKKNKSLNSQSQVITSPPLPPCPLSDALPPGGPHTPLVIAGVIALELRERVFIGSRPQLHEVSHPAFLHGDMVIAQKHSPWSVFPAYSAVSLFVMFLIAYWCLIAC